MSKNINGTKGYDAPVDVRALDDYQRWPTASAISNVIRTAPAEWSTRIGLYGRWGDGKTTVLNFLESQQTKEGNIVIRYSPWGATTEEMVWREFAKTLRTGLKKAGITFSRTAVLVQFAKWKPSLVASILRGGGKLANAKVPGASVVTDATAGIIEKLLGFSKKDIEALVAKVEDRRVIIFIDDLDRTDPAIIPRLLLALRELLDLPKFVFVLAFDKRVVCPALGQHNPAWGKSGETFLEKIVDFPFDLAAPERAHVKALAVRYFNEINDFFPVEVIDDVLALLPNNPRRLKLLFRIIASLGPEARRHDADELDWTSILIFHMLRFESDEFTRQLVHKILETKEFSWMRWALSDQEKAEEEALFDKFINDFFSHDESERRQRVRLLVQAWREKRAFQGGERLRYQISFGDRPHHITWGEFKQGFNSWRNNRAREHIEIFLRTRAEHLDSSVDEAASEMMQSALEYYGGKLEQASQARTDDQHRSLIEEASDVLSLCEDLAENRVAEVTPTSVQQPHHFAHFMGIALRWVHFRRNAGEPELREREASLLISWCNTWPPKMALFSATQPWSDDDWGQDAETRELRENLRSRLQNALWPFAINAALGLFEMPNGVASVFPSDANEALYFALAAPKSKLYQSDGFERLSAVLNRASKSDVIHENAVSYLQLLIAGLTHEGRYCGRQERIDFFREHPLLAEVVWHAVVAKRAQYRFLSSIKKFRSTLIEIGQVPDAALPAPEWLL